jgi:peptidyl-prolyl cis-trans isomerase D
MALIGKIRKNFWLVLILLGMALAAFILMDIAGSQGGASLFNQTTVGKVAGEKIDMLDFQKTEAALFSGSPDLYQRREQLWNYVVEKAILDKEAGKMGIAVSPAELEDLQFGSNLSPVIQNNFANQQTGQVDFQQLMQIKQMIEQGELDTNPNLRSFWTEQEKQIIKTRVQEKMNTIVSKSIYAPMWQVEVQNELNTNSADFDYVKVPFDAIDDASANLTDDDFKKYIAKNSHLYTNKEETRLVKYVSINVVPSSEDSLNIKNNLDELGEEFRTTDNDSLFAVVNDGFITPIFAERDQLQGELKDSIDNINPGDLYGPYIDNDLYIIAKLIERKSIPDSVQARHILISANEADRSSVAIALARIDSIKAELQTGRVSFDTLAVRHSEDPGSSFNGGDLGTFQQGMMVPAFNDACFLDSREGGLYTVTTSFGVHLIEVQKRIFNSDEPKYKVGYVFKPIIPSEETQDAFFDIANELVINNRNIEALTKAVEDSGNLVLETTAPLTKNSHTFGNLGSSETSREIVKWAFRSKEGEVSSKIYTFVDPVQRFNSAYVVVSLSKINKEGLQSVDALRNQIEFAVKNEKKAKMIIDRLASKDLNAAASEFGVNVESATNATFASAFLPELGAEPNVFATVFGTPC